MWTKIISCFLYERNRWLLWLPIFFAFGIGIYFLLPEEPSLFMTNIVLFILIVGLFVFRRYLLLRSIFLLLFLIAAGFANIQYRTILLSDEINFEQEQKLYIRGQIDNIDANYNGRQRILLSSMFDFDDNPLKGRYRLTLIHQNPDIKVGDVVELIGVVSPLFKPSIVGGYEFDRNFYFKGVTGTGYIPSDVIKITSFPRFKDYFAMLRENISRRIYEILPTDRAAVTIALVTGDQTKISHSLIEAYRDSGLAHFLSISGLHMSMLAGLMFLLVRVFMALIPSLALRFNSKKTAALLSIVVSSVYLILSGMSVPAQRAFIMTQVVLAAVLFERQAISMRTLACSAFIVLIISPAALISASFQMSFAAVTALVAFYEKFAGRLNHFLSDEKISLTHKIFRGLMLYCVGVLVADFVASVATLPFAIYHFNRVALYTSLTNLLSGPIISFIIMPFILVSLLTMPLGLEVLPLKIVGFGLAIVNKLTLWVASLPNAVVGVVSMPFWGFILIIFGGLWLCLWIGRWRLWGVAPIIIGFLSILCVQKPEVIIDSQIKTIAVLNHNNGKYYFLPQANRWNKRNWLTKFAADEETEDKFINNPIYQKRIKIESGNYVKIDGQDFDVRLAGGVSIFADKDKLVLKTVREYIGCRYWNCIIDK